MLVRLGWLAQPHLDEWRQGPVESLEQVIQVNPHKLSTAMRLFHR